MSIKRSLTGALTLAFAVAVVGPGAAQTSGTAPAKPENTKLNRTEQPTADQQSNTKNDRELTRQIRRAITADKQLSTSGRNVKVIVQDGKVTLKGPVRSADEKQAIESKATEVAGPGTVTNDLRIAPKKG
jgi:hyperosmotically inducible periplasmic protein